MSTTDVLQVLINRKDIESLWRLYMTSQDVRQYLDQPDILDYLSKLYKIELSPDSAFLDFLNQYEKEHYITRCLEYNDYDYNKCLKWAIEVDNLEMVIELLPHTNRMYPDKIVELAAKYDSINVFSTYIDKINKEIKDDIIYYRLALDTIEYRSYDILRKLLNTKHQDISRYISDLAWRMVDIGDDIEFYISLPYLKLKHYKSIFNIAARKGNIGIMKELLTLDPDLEYIKLDTAMNEAASHGKYLAYKFIKSRKGYVKSPEIYKHAGYGHNKDIIEDLMRKDPRSSHIADIIEGMSVDAPDKKNIDIDLVKSLVSRIHIRDAFKPFDLALTRSKDNPDAYTIANIIYSHFGPKLLDPVKVRKMFINILTGSEGGVGLLQFYEEHNLPIHIHDVLRIIVGSKQQSRQSVGVIKYILENYKINENDLLSLLISYLIKDEKDIIKSVLLRILPESFDVLDEVYRILYIIFKSNMFSYSSDKRGRIFDLQQQIVNFTCRADPNKIHNELRRKFFKSSKAATIYEILFKILNILNDVIMSSEVRNNESYQYSISRTPSIFKSLEPL